MYRQLWIETHRSICSISFMENGRRLSSGSGFCIGKKIVTNNHVIQISQASHVRVRFVSANGHSVLAEKLFTTAEFRARLLEGDPESGWDYAIFDMDLEEFEKIPSLSLRADDDVEIGASIAIFGFQFEQSNLSLHSGVLSSKFVENSVNYLQLDASVNHGNSGGPLILPETGEVIGVVTRKATGLTDEFDMLIDSFRQNMQLLQHRGGVEIAGIDPIQVFRATQAQLSRVALEIKRSANVGVGYAYELRRVRMSAALDS